MPKGKSSLYVQSIIVPQAYRIDIFRKVRSPYQQCMASFPAQTAKISSNYIMTPISGDVVSLRVRIKAQFLATSAIFLA